MFKLNRDMLLDRDPCREGLAVWDALFPEGVELRGGWTRWCQAVVLGHPGLRRWWAWCVEEGLIPSWSLRGLVLHKAELYNADMARVDLAESDLGGANLCGADLSYANLRDADLEECWAYGAFFDHAIMCRARLFQADLREASLFEADLREADLSYADLRGADLAGADLRNAWLFGAKRLDTDPPVPGWTLTSGELRGNA